MDDHSLDRLPGNVSVRNQLDRASTSVPLNIAEGNGKFTSPDRCRFFDNSRGSALESAACLDVMVAKRFVSAADPNWQRDAREDRIDAVWTDPRKFRCARLRRDTK